MTQTFALKDFVMRINIFDIYTYDKKKLLSICESLNISPERFCIWVQNTLRRSSKLVGKIEIIINHPNFKKMGGSRIDAIGQKHGMETAMVSCCQTILKTLEDIHTGIIKHRGPVSAAEIDDILYHLETKE